MRHETEYGYYIVDEEGRYHSYDDEPAIVVNDHEENIAGNIENVDGYRAWYEHGVITRDGKPAVIRNNGEEYYYHNGEIINQ